MQAMRLGAADFLTKPINLEHLKLVVERALRERALEDEVDDAAREAATSSSSFTASSAKARGCTTCSS